MSPEPVGVEAVHPAIELGDAPLLFRGLGLLHYSHDPTAPVSQDAPKVHRLLGGNSEHGDNHATPFPVVTHQPLEGLDGQQGHVPVEHHNLVGTPFQEPTSLRDGMTGAQLLLLDDVQNLIPDDFPHATARGADHHGHCYGAQVSYVVQHVPDHGYASHRMQHLGRPRLHPLALTGRQDDNS